MSKTIHFIACPAPLLSGSLNECTSPEDKTCQGGVAASAAFARAYSKNDNFLFLPFLDRESPFVQMTPLGWSVNRLIFQYYIGAKAFLTAPSILQQNKADSNVSQRDISELQSTDLPLLLSNVQVPLANSWNQYHVSIFRDAHTGLAVMSIVNSGEALNVPQIETALSGLDYLARINKEAGCMGDYRNPFLEFESLNTTEQRVCWIPVIIFFDAKEQFEKLLEAVLQHEHPPKFILDTAETSPPLEVPREVGPGTWLVSLRLEDYRYQHNVLTLSNDLKSITNVSVIAHGLNFSLPDVPQDARDEQYNNTIINLARLAEDARDNDPFLANSKFMKVQRSGSYRPCKAGQWESGSLFVDAL